MTVFNKVGITEKSSSKYSIILVKNPFNPYLLNRNIIEKKHVSSTTVGWLNMLLPANRRKQVSQ